MSEDAAVERLKRLQRELERVQKASRQLHDAAEDPNHRLNTWPYRERRASFRPSSKAR